MNTGPLVSVIIPTFNRAAQVGNAIDSVQHQTYQNVEIIIVDDGSTDDTPDVLAGYGSTVRVVTQKNRGVAAARNAGLNASRGDVITMLDSDDAWLPSKVERQMRILDAAGVSVPACLCNAIVEHEGGPETTTFDIAELHPAVEEGVWTNPTEVLLTRFVLFAQTIAVRRTAVEKVGLFDESLQVLEDHEWALRLSLVGPWAFLSQPLVRYSRNSPGSLAERALRDELFHRDCQVRMRTSFDQRLAEAGGTAAQATLSRVERRVSSALLLLCRLSRRNGLLTKVAGAWPRHLDKYRKAVYRRTPWYPQMRVQNLTSRERAATPPR